MIWLFWLSLAGVLAFFSESEFRNGLIAICVGLILVWLFKGLLSEVAFWVFSALIWIVLGLFVATYGSGYSIVSGLFLIAAGAIVLPARLSGYDYAHGNPWLAGSDVLGVCAILVLGWPAIGDAVSRAWGVVGSYRSGDNSDNLPDRAASSEAPE